MQAMPSTLEQCELLREQSRTLCDELEELRDTSRLLKEEVRETHARSRAARDRAQELVRLRRETAHKMVTVTI